MKRIFILGVTAAAAAVFIRSDVAQAQLGTASTTAACCQLTTSLVAEQLHGRDIISDERFFMSEGAPPNIHFLIDNSGSMRELPQVQNSDERTFFNLQTDPAVDANAGCSNSRLLAVSTSRGWNAANSYPPPDMGTGLGSDNGFPDLFKEDRFYTYMSWGDSDNPPKYDKTTVPEVCQKLWPNYATTGSRDATEEPRCEACLNTQGFYKDPYKKYDDWGAENRFILSGKFLNFNPPKYVTLRKVIKEVIKDLRRVRAGMSTFDGSNGGKMRREQNPSCDQIIKDASSFDSNRGSYINDINGYSFNTSTPLAESLFNIGEYFSADDDVYTKVYGFDKTYLKGEFKNGSLTSQGRSWCWGCQTSSVIIITDGEPNNDTNLPRTKLINWNKTTDNPTGNTFCPDYNGDGSGDCATAEYWKSNDLLDDVARFLNTHDLQVHTPVIIGDLNTAGKQSLNIYGVGLGVSSAILRNATEGVGGGLYYEANDATELKNAIMEIIANVQTRATAFAAASVASLQVNRTGGSLLPRFKPSRTGNKGEWQGFLYRFELGLERLQGCDPTQAATILTGGAGDPNDANSDGDCQDVNLLDKNGKPVIEDDQGNFVLLNDPLTPASPYWEAGGIMKGGTGQTQKWKTRNIWTIVDNASNSNGVCGAGTDNKLDRCDTPVAFTEDNASVLREYLGIGNNLTECSALATQLGLASLTADDCAKLVIRYYRGADVLNADPVKRDYDRAFLLEDIFHSAPQTVEPPTDKTLCGYNNQCVVTLYRGKTPLGDGVTDPSKDAYDSWVKKYGTRDRVVLVGSNGGMLHAFHNGKYTGVDPDTGMALYDQGTGAELWAFVPPDLLPKMREGMGRHRYFVDATPMIRDVWMDANGDGKKQEGEFRTITIVGEGVGGTHRFALDLTRLIGESGTRAHSAPNKAGDFLWTWPQPCDNEALLVGESSGTFAPKPPPIGPVAIADKNGPWEINKVPAREQWIAFFNGGNDPTMTRGRGMAMVDLQTGKTLWSFFHGETKTNADKMQYPVAAAMAMMDVGNAYGSAPDNDMLFDTATVGDYGGQVWVARFWNPGEIDAASGRVSNWNAARSFRVQAQESDSVRPPITFMTSNTLQPDTGFLRTFVGTGDRDNLMDSPGPICRLSNPIGCARQGCHVNTTVTINRGGTNAFTGRSEFEGLKLKSATEATATAATTCSSAQVNLHWKIDGGGACRVKEEGDRTLLCDGAVAAWQCRFTKDDWIIRNEPADPPPTTPMNRFYGFWSYGINPARIFNDDTTAAAFDAARIRDSDLVDVTGATADTTGTSTINAGNLAKGWMVKYTPVDERTGSGSTILDGCVLWNSFETVGAAAVCSTSGANVARFYQGQFVSGAPNCAASFFDPATGYKRSIARNVVAVPGEPTPQRTIYKGQGGTSVITMEAGRNQGDSVSENKELVQHVMQLEVDRAAHDCRHEGVGCE